MTEAIEAHLRAMREDGDAIPEPSHSADMLEVAWPGTVEKPLVGVPAASDPPAEADCQPIVAGFDRWRSRMDDLVRTRPVFSCAYRVGPAPRDATVSGGVAQ